MVFLISDIDTLEAVNVSWQSCFVYVCFAGLNDLNESIVNEDVLFLSLNQMCPLCPDVLQVAEGVDIPSCFDLPQHGIEDNVAASSTHSSAVMT